MKNFTPLETMKLLFSLLLLFIVKATDTTDQESQTDEFHPQSGHPHVVSLPHGIALPLGLQCIQNLLMPNLEVKDQMIFKMTSTQFSNLRLVGSPYNFLPNEGEIKIFRDVESGDFTWKDPNDLIPVKTKDFIKKLLKKEGARNVMANAFFEWFARDCECDRYRREDDGNRFMQKLVAYMSLFVDVNTNFVPSRPNDLYITNHYYNTPTPVLFATYFKAAKAVQILLDRGANVNSEKKVVDCAIKSFDPVVFSNLLRAGLNPDDVLFEIASSSLPTFSTNERAQSCKMLLDLNPSINLNILREGSWEGYTYLNQVAYYNSIEVAKILIDAGADLNIPESKYGYTPLMTSVYYGHLEITNYLVQGGANLDVCDKYHRRTALQIFTITWNIDLDRFSEYESDREKCARELKEAGFYPRNEPQFPHHVGTMVKVKNPKPLSNPPLRPHPPWSDLDLPSKMHTICIVAVMLYCAFIWSALLVGTFINAVHEKQYGTLYFKPKDDI